MTRDIWWPYLVQRARGNGDIRGGNHRWETVDQAVSYRAAYAKCWERRDKRLRIVALDGEPVFWQAA
jgi:hypothetical protein